MSILQNYQAYDKNQFEILFKQTHVYQQLSKKYKLINFDRNYQHFISNVNGKLSNRKIKSDSNHWEENETLRGQLEKNGIVDATDFYYLKYLTDTDTEKIYDIGCGCNFYKNYIPNLTTISGNSPSSRFFYGDEYGWIDNTYIAQHQNFFPSAFAIVSLHFIPVTEIRKRVMDFMSMIQPGGRGFLSMSSYEMVDGSIDTDILENLDIYIRTQLCDMPFEYLVVDIDEVNRKLLGNIQLVMQK